MELRQLEIFLAVVDQRSFSAAAEKIHLSQSTVSTQILALEEELQTELIHRTTRSFTPTSRGLRLYAYATDILQLRQKAERELAGGEKTTLEIGTSSVPAVCIVPELLCRFRAQSPDIRYNVVEDDSVNIIDKVASGTLDIGFVGTKTEDSACDFIPLSGDELVIVTPNCGVYSNALLQKAPVRELLKHPFLMRGFTSGTKKETLRVLAKIGVFEEDLDIAAHINDAETLCRCVVKGLGISILSKRAVERQVQRKELLVYPLGEASSFRTLYMVFHRTKYTPVSVKQFVRLAEQLYLPDGAPVSDSCQ